MRATTRGLGLLLVLTCACGDAPPGSAADRGAAPDGGAAGRDSLLAVPDRHPARTDGPGATRCPTTLVDWVAASSYIFKAKVTRIGEATEQAPPSFADPLKLWDLSRMVVVRVERSLHSPGSINLAHFAGREITVRLPDRPTFKVGHQGYFLAKFWIAGKSLVLYGVAELDAGRFACVEGAVPAVLTYLRRKNLYDRMQAAALVVDGEVESVKDLKLGFVSAYNPAWHEARMTIHEVLRGQVLTRPLAVRFAASEDHSHYQKPKLKAGQRSVFILNKDTVTGAKTPGHLVLHADEVQEPAKKSLLRSLLKSPPQKPL